MSFYVEILNNSLSLTKLLDEYQLAVTSGKFLTILYAQNNLILNNISSSYVLNSNDFSSDVIVIDDDLNTTTNVRDFISLYYIFIAIIPGFLIFILRCIVEFLRQFYREHICLPDD